MICGNVIDFEDFTNRLKNSNSIEDIMALLPEFKSHNIDEVNELSYVIYNSREYFIIVKECIIEYSEQFRIHREDNVELKQLVNILTIILPKAEHNKILRNMDLGHLSKLLNLVEKGIFMFNPETPEYDQHDHISTTFSNLENKMDNYLQIHPNNNICVMFNHNNHWRCVAIRKNLAVYSDGIIGSSSEYAQQICNIVSKILHIKIQLHTYNCDEQKDKKRCGLYALRTAMFSIRQSQEEFETFYHKIQILQDIITYIEDKIIRNIIKINVFRHNEPEKYQEALIETFIIYGLLKYQRHFLDVKVIDLTKLYGTLIDRNLHLNFRRVSDNQRHVIDLHRYNHIIEEMVIHLKNDILKKRICERLLSKTQKCGGQNLCDGLVKFPSATITYDDIIGKKDIINTLVWKKERLTELINEN